MRRVTERGARPATYQSEYYTEDVYGHHNEAPEFNVLGVDFSKRGVRSEESILAMRALWRDGHASFHGTKVSFPEVLSYPQPV